MAVDCGADAVVVSNHGGHQLDGSRSTIRVLSGVADALTGQAKILLDGGIRRGGDVLKALLRGADACLLGRAYVYALAAAGEAGLDAWLQLLTAELDADAALYGISTLAGVIEKVAEDWPASRWDELMP